MKNLLFLILLAMALVANAQTIVTGDVSGLVTDPTGAVVANAKATLTGDATGETKTAMSNSTGEFRFPMLRPGPYTLNVSAPGFQDTAQKVTASLGQVTSLKIQLGLQSQTQTVTVNEQAPLIQSDNANMATTYNELQLANLPAPGNDMTSYAFTTPGVTVSTGGGYGNFSAFGLPGVSNLFTTNGADNMDPYLNLNNSGASNLTLGANEVQEAAVILNGYTGQYGRQAGAQVNFVTKSGTNAFHGNAARFWNGAKLNANDWFNNANDTSRPHAVSNEWADSIGGPIKKNKAFFYFDNEGLRYVLPSGGPVFIPTTDFASYVLSNMQKTNPAAVPFYQNALNLYNGASGAGRARPLNANDDAALGCGDLANLNDAGTKVISSSAGAFGLTSPCARVFQNSVNNLNTEWLLAAKVDLSMTPNDRVYFRYNMDRGVQATGTDPVNAAFNSNSIQPSYGGQLGYTRTLGASMINQLLASASYYTAIFGPPDYANAIKTFPSTWAFVDGAPYTAMGGADNIYPQGRKVRQWQLIDDFSKLWRAHTFKFGTNIRKNWVSTYATLPQQFGLVTFNSMTDFLNGSLTQGSTFAQNFPQVGAEGVTLYSAGFYLQDEWKVRGNLTLTLALRFDRNSNITCAGKCFNELLSPFASLAHNAATPYNTTIHTGLSQGFPSLEPIVTEPRIGIAYRATKSTVLRGGFGIFSDLYQAVLADRFLTNSPAVPSFTTSSGLVALNDPSSIFASVGNSNTAFKNGFASGATLAQLQAAVPLGFTPPNFNTISSTLRNPKYYEWNFEIQQALGNKYMFSVNYVGNHGIDAFNQTLFQNAYSPNNFAGLPATRPDPRFGEIREFGNDGWSYYNGLVTAFRWRMGSQFSGSFSYTWSHALDTCSNACIEPFNALSAPSIRYQLSSASVGNLSYSSADYDTRHSFNANYVYAVPSSYFHNWLTKNVLGGWTVAGTLLAHSGYPFSVVDSSVRTKQGIGAASGIATQQFLAGYLGTGYPTCATPNVQCLASSLFVSAANQHNFGNIPRNSFRGPNYVNTDLNLSKMFSLHERYKVQIGAFFFNVLNHPNFDNPFNNMAVGTFGQILATVSAPTSAYGAFQGSAVSGRIIQTQVKFIF
jgi:Carboxypeptidase regulatory-like domain